MKIEIDIDEECIPDGYDAVGFGMARESESFMDGNGHVLVEGDTGCANGPRLILKKKITFPSFIVFGSAWFSKEHNDITHISKFKPRFEEDLWRTDGRMKRSVKALNEILDCNLPDPFEGKKGGPDCLAYWDADKGELTYYREGE